MGVRKSVGKARFLDTRLRLLFVLCEVLGVARWEGRVVYLRGFEKRDCKRGKVGAILLFPPSQSYVQRAFVGHLFWFLSF